MNLTDGMNFDYTVQTGRVMLLDKVVPRFVVISLCQLIVWKMRVPMLLCLETKKWLLNVLCVCVWVYIDVCLFVEDLSPNIESKGKAAA